MMGVKTPSGRAKASWVLPRGQGRLLRARNLNGTVKGQQESARQTRWGKEHSRQKPENVKHKGAGDYAQRRREVLYGYNDG